MVDETGWSQNNSKKKRLVVKEILDIVTGFPIDSKTEQRVLIDGNGGDVTPDQQNSCIQMLWAVEKRFRGDAKFSCNTAIYENNEISAKNMACYIAEHFSYLDDGEKNRIEFHYASNLRMLDYYEELLRDVLHLNGKKPVGMAFGDPNGFTQAKGTTELDLMMRLSHKAELEKVSLLSHFSGTAWKRLVKGTLGHYKMPWEYVFSGINRKYIYICSANSVHQFTFLFATNDERFNEDENIKKRFKKLGMYLIQAPVGVAINYKGTKMLQRMSSTREELKEIGGGISKSFLRKRGRRATRNFVSVTPHGTIKLSSATSTNYIAPDAVSVELSFSHDGSKMALKFFSEDDDSRYRIFRYGGRKSISFGAASVLRKQGVLRDVKMVCTPVYDAENDLLILDLESGAPTGCADINSLERRSCA